MKTRNLIIATVLGASFSCLADNWASWRGDLAGSGAAPNAKGLPAEFGADDKLVFKASLPGRGNSTPAVWGEQIFVTCGIGGKDAVVAYDWKGKEQWRVTYGTETPGKGKRVGTGSNSSPITDGKALFSYFKSGTVVGVSTSGKKVWEVNLQEKYGKDTLWWDQGTSPVLAGGNVVVAVMQTEGNSYLISLDRNTGKEVWKTDRKFDVAAESGDSYTTPLVVDINGTETIITWGADHVTGHDAKTGKQIWFSGGFNPKKTKFWRVIASPVTEDGIVVVPYARGEKVGAIRALGNGDITKDAWLWKREGVGTDAATPAVHDRNVYVLTDSGKKRGLVTCLDLGSGKTLWETALPKGPQQYYASPLIAGDKLYCAREDGVIFCGTITKTGLKDIKESRLEETVIASPVAIGKKLLIRGRDHLFCFGG